MNRNYISSGIMGIALSALCLNITENAYPKCSQPLDNCSGTPNGQLEYHCCDQWGIGQANCFWVTKRSCSMGGYDYTSGNYEPGECGGDGPQQKCMPY